MILEEIEGERCPVIPLNTYTNIFWFNANMLLENRSTCNSRNIVASSWPMIDQTKYYSSFYHYYFFSDSGSPPKGIPQFFFLSISYRIQVYIHLEGGYLWV